MGGCSAAITRHIDSNTGSQAEAGAITAPNERHWHGATSSTLMSHTTTTIGATEFHDAVTEAEYAAANASPRA